MSDDDKDLVGDGVDFSHPIGADLEDDLGVDTGDTTDELAEGFHIVGSDDEDEVE